MKFNRITAAAFIVGLVFASASANATNAPVTLTCPVTTDKNSCSIDSYNSPQLFGYSTHDFLVTGKLHNNTELTIVYTATNVASYLLAKGDVLPGTKTLAQLISSAWPALSTSAVLKKGTLTDTLVLKNLSGHTENYAAYFVSVIKALRGKVASAYIYATITSIPLPGAIFLFGSGLAAVAGFGARKFRA